MDPRISEYARIIVQYSIGVKPGDKVVIEAHTTAIELVRELYKRILLAGGHPLPLLLDQTCIDIFHQMANGHQLDFLWPIALEKVKAADKWISIDGEDNTKANTNVDLEKSQRIMMAHKPLNDLWTERTCAYGKPNFLPHVVTQFPCNSAAQDAEMSLMEYEDFVYRAAKIQVDNKDPVLAWIEEEGKQRQLINKLNQLTEFRFVTLNGTDIRFIVDNSRQWWPCAGRENFPDGEIYTTPLENSATGIIVFSFPTVYDGVEVDGVTLRFNNGKVVTAEAKKNQDYLHAMIQMPGGNRLGELAFGVNNDIQIFTKNILFDEKIGGTFHIALGDSYPNTGGTNESEIHWDMINDLRAGGNVYGDGKLIQENGKWLI